MPPADIATALTDLPAAEHRAPLGTVLVTGAASGLGAAVAAAVAGAGGTPVSLDLVPAPGGIDHELVDLSDTAEAHAAVARVVERHGGVDAVVTAAGVDACGRLDEVPAEAWERVVAVNLLGTAAVVGRPCPRCASAAAGSSRSRPPSACAR